MGPQPGAVENTMAMVVMLVVPVAVLMVMFWSARHAIIFPAVHQIARQKIAALSFWSARTPTMRKAPGRFLVSTSTA